MSPSVVTELQDRWIIHARQSVVAHLEASPSSLRIELDSGLWVEVAGKWRATVGPPITAVELSPEQVADQVGSRVLAFVLFWSGSMRMMLSKKAMIVAGTDDNTRVSATLPGKFTWEAHAGSVTHWLAERAQE